MPEPGFPGYDPEVKKNILERAPLREGIMPISIQLMDMYKETEESEEFEELRGEIKDDVDNADYEHGDFTELKKNGFKHAGRGSYLISPIDGRNWYSDQYANCTAVVAIGRDKETGKEISFLSHQNPKYFIDGESDKVGNFSRDLSQSLEDLKARSEADTVEVFLLGGNYNPSAVENENNYQHHHYKQSIEKLRQIVQKTLGFDPTVATGPNNNVGSETALLVETQERKLWIERTEQPSEFDQPYQANEFDEMEKEWREASKKK